MRIIFRSKYDVFQVFVLVLFVHVVFVSFSVHTVQLCEETRTGCLSNLDSQSVTTIREGNFELSVPVKLKRGIV